MRSTTELVKNSWNEEMKEYLSIIQNGLPKKSNSTEIAIIGAGIAGLVTANLLADAGFKVTIYEASNRIGGRVKTIREPFSNGLYAEAGAMRIPSFYKLTLEYIKQLGLKTNEFLNHDKNGNEYIFVNGVKQCRKDYLKNKAKGLNYPLLDIEEGFTAEDLLNQALSNIARYVGNNTLEGYQTNRWKEVVQKYGEYSVREFLKLETFYSEGAIEMIEVLNDLESRSNQSLIQQIVEVNDHGSDVKYVEITGGMDKLADAFLPILSQKGVNIIFNKRLIAIDRTNAKIKLSFKEDYQSNLREFATVETSAVVITIPFPGLKYVNIIPMLEHNKRKAIRELHYDSSTKILLEFKSRFWETNDGIYGGSTVTDLPSRFIYYPNHDFDGKNGGVITSSYTWGDEARAWDSLSKADQIRCSLNDIATIHGDYIRDEFIAGYVQSWDKDCYSYGEAAMFYGGQLKELQEYIPVPDGDLYFAGEHTSLKHAWIEGAIESGIRVALEIIKNKS